MSDAPRPMTLTEYAKRRGVSKNAVSLAIKKGRLKACVVRTPMGKPGISDPELADREWMANSDYTQTADFRPLRDEWWDESTEESPESMDDSSSKQKFWKAKLAELEFKKEAGDLIKAADVERGMADRAVRIKTRLFGIPTRLKQALPELTVAQMAKLDDLLREVLEELSNGQ